MKHTKVITIEREKLNHICKIITDNEDGNVFEILFETRFNDGTLLVCEFMHQRNEKITDNKIIYKYTDKKKAVSTVRKKIYSVCDFLETLQRNEHRNYKVKVFIAEENYDVLLNKITDRHNCIDGIPKIVPISTILPYDRYIEIVDNIKTQCDTSERELLFSAGDKKDYVIFCEMTYSKSATTLRCCLETDNDHTEIVFNINTEDDLIEALQKISLPLNKVIYDVEVFINQGTSIFYPQNISPIKKKATTSKLLAHFMLCGALFALATKVIERNLTSDWTSYLWIIASVIIGTTLIFTLFSSYAFSFLLSKAATCRLKGELNKFDKLRTPLVLYISTYLLSISKIGWICSLYDMSKYIYLVWVLVILFVPQKLIRRNRNA